MATVQILVDILQRMTNVYSEEVESLAECVSMNATGNYEDMSEDDANEVRKGRELVAEAKTVIESLNLGFEHTNDSFDFSSVRAKGERIRSL